jgi:hypothetical protein
MADQTFGALAKPLTEVANVFGKAFHTVPVSGGREICLAIAIDWWSSRKQRRNLNERFRQEDRNGIQVTANRRKP